MTTTHAPTHALASVTPASLEELIGSSQVPVLVDMWAEWCGPCHMLERALALLAEERDDLRIVSLDTDAHPDLARRFDVLSVPTMLLFVDGELVGRLVGARPLRRLAADIVVILGSSVAM